MIIKEKEKKTVLIIRHYHGDTYRIKEKNEIYSNKTVPITTIYIKQ